MTIKQFQELWYIAQSKDFDIDKSVKMVGVVTGLTPDQVDKMKISKFNKLCAKIHKQFEIFDRDLLKGRPVKFVRANGRVYQLHYRIDRHPINAGRYVETISYGKDVVNNLHKIMASIATPVNWMGKPYKRDHVDIASDMENVNFEAAYQAAVFFYTLYNVLMKLIQPYLVKEIMTKGKTRTEAEGILTNSLKYLDGFITPNWSQNLKPYLLNRFGI